MVAEKCINGMIPIGEIQFVRIADHVDTANKGKKQADQWPGQMILRESVRQYPQGRS